MNIRSLESMCLHAIVNSCNKEGQSVEKIKELIPEVLFLQAKHIQETTVNLTIANWNNPDLCLGKIENFSINKPLSEILNFVSSKTNSLAWKTIYIDDLDGNSRHPGHPMWETASKEKTLSEYGFKPAQNITVLLNR